ncbi:MAG TPA: 4a-hydroxytetrahydrobiopterin dehydratase [Candidatus Thermoplasmatota archaeon]|nr:4a-hydroxytetrahydrobiopterin dehydratase [Candidatus Thermoplasmatota archaeon]
MPTFPKDWQVDEGGTRVWIDVRTRDFADALSLFAEVGALAEALDHHPDLHLEAWNRVRLVSYSHDVGHLTERDERLVAEMDRVLRRRGLLSGGREETRGS